MFSQLLEETSFIEMGFQSNHSLDLGLMWLLFEKLKWLGCESASAYLSQMLV